MILLRMGQAAPRREDLKSVQVIRLGRLSSERAASST